MTPPLCGGGAGEPDAVIGDVHSLAACNETGRRRLIEALDLLESEPARAAAAAGAPRFVWEALRASSSSTPLRRP